MGTGHLPSAEELAREVRLVLDAGTRAATIARCLARLPNLSRMIVDPVQQTDLGVAIAVCNLIASSVTGLGSGPYGRAAGHLFGLSDEARGLKLSRRRGLAAEALDVQPATLTRWWQRRIVEDVTSGCLECCKVY